MPGKLCHGLYKTQDFESMMQQYFKSTVAAAQRGIRKITDEGGKVAFVLVSGNVIVDVWHMRIVLQVK